MGRFEDAILEERNYWNDPRTHPKDGLKGYNSKTKKVTHHLYFEVETEHGWVCEEEFPVTFPTKMEVCYVCDGQGKYVNPSIDAGGLTQEDFSEDPYFAEDYWSGVYDVTCEACHGNNVIAVIDETSYEMKKEIEIPIRNNGYETGEVKKFTLAELYKFYQESEYQDAMYERECRMERMMGC